MDDFPFCHLLDVICLFAFFSLSFSALMSNMFCAFFLSMKKNHEISILIELANENSCCDYGLNSRILVLIVDVLPSLCRSGAV